MSANVKMYIAASLNSRIADKEGGVGWLDDIPHPEGEDYGYATFYEAIGTTIMGYATYAQLKSWDIPFPYKDKKNYVITRKKSLPTDENVEFITKRHIEAVHKLKTKSAKDIWLIGGGKVNTLLLNAGLVDEIIVHLMPLVLDKGIELFEDMPDQTQLLLLSTRSYDSGVVELRYKVT